MKLDRESLHSELTFRAVRSSGSGGQHVNKVSTKVELHFNIVESNVLDDIQKNKLLKTLSNRISKNGILIISCDESRSQVRNKTIVTKRFFDLLEAHLKKKKKRKPTQIPKAAKQKRLEAKRKQAEKKAQRKPPNLG